MPALVDIRRRIRSVKNTQQITRAMKMVSAAKLRRAQQAMFAARPFARKLLEVLSSVARRADPSLHPLLRQHGESRILLVVITADKGLCGGFNANITRAALGFLEGRREQDLSVGFVGRKGRDFFKRRSFKVHSEHVGIFQALKYSFARDLAQGLIRDFVEGRVDEVHLAYNEFKTVIQQRVVVERLLPIQRTESPSGLPDLDYLYEPNPAEIFTALLPKYVEILVWSALLESAAAEHGARMAAMDSATNNAEDMIERLTLFMNKVRQAAITKEIIEVVSGAGSPV